MESSEGNTQQSFLFKLREIVLDNLKNEQFSVEELASTYGLSRSQLHKKLKKSEGKSISQFIKEVRLEKSLELLNNDDTITASEVAYEVGFSSPTYFNTCFKDFFGFPPGEARMRAKIQDDMGLDNAEHGDFKPNPNRKAIIFSVSLLVLIAALYGLYRFNITNDTINNDFQHGTAKNTASKIEKSIAVLPLKNWSGDSGLEYVSDGLTDALISKIANVSSLAKVVPFTTMLTYKETGKKIKEVAKEQNVSHILQGSFQLSGNQVKISLQLIEGQSSEQVWSNEYSSKWKSSEIFTLQEEVTKNVLNALNVVITEKESKMLTRIPTDNHEAYNYFLLAEYQRYQYQNEAFKKAIPLYKKAIALDSAFVDPYGALAEVYIFQGLIMAMESEEQSWKKAKELLKKAELLDPSNELVREKLLNVYFFYEWDFDRLSRLPESDKDLMYDFRIKIGEYEKALKHINTLILDNPIGVSYGKKAEVLFLMGRKDLCEALLKKHDVLFDDGFYVRESAKWHYYLGNYSKSKEQLDKLVGMSKNFPPIVIWLQAIHANIDGDLGKANKKYAILRDKFDNQESGSPGWFMALYHFHSNEPDKGFRWLEKSFDRHEVEMIWLRAEPLLAPYRDDSRYIELYYKMQFPVPIP
ncbi:helix-turn-helix domain-containing protein [Ulvibacterium sp.]|uniref:helix-turn-helix domain-containing protein n=1 Tax=Ulvibacterium sp. TaxID=2665914 RepID=UPI003BAA9ADB